MVVDATKWFRNWFFEEKGTLISTKLDFFKASFREQIYEPSGGRRELRAL